MPSSLTPNQHNFPFYQASSRPHSQELVFKHLILIKRLQDYSAIAYFPINSYFPQKTAPILTGYYEFGETKPFRPGKQTGLKDLGELGALHGTA